MVYVKSYRTALPEAVHDAKVQTTQMNLLLCESSCDEWEQLKMYFEHYAMHIEGTLAEPLTF